MINVGDIANHENEILPISIQSSEELVIQFININSVTNKLEALFNFHTLTASWYENEDNILLIRLFLVMEDDFIEQKDLYQNKQKDKNTDKLYHFSDDVFSYHAINKQQIETYIAITASEQKLLLLEKKLLANYLEIKMRKVLNLIAQQLKLSLI
ncbi:MAG: hypothetical protein OCD00_12055 [Colwellia sp.]